MRPEKANQSKKASFQELGEVYNAERSSMSLTRLPDDFYTRAVDYLRSLLVSMENCGSEDGPSVNEEYHHLSDEYMRAKDILERVFTTRQRKIVLTALNASRTKEPEAKGGMMDNDEADFYYSMKISLENLRDRVLRYDRLLKRPQRIRPETGIDTSTDDFLEEGVLDGRQIAPGSAEGPAAVPKERKTPPDTGKGSLIGDDGTVPDAPAPAHKGGSAIVVRALQDIEPYVDVEGRTVFLKKDDVATVDEQTGSILVESGMASIVREE